MLIRLHNAFRGGRATAFQVNLSMVAVALYLAASHPALLPMTCASTGESEACEMEVMACCTEGVMACCATAPTEPATTTASVDPGGDTILAQAASPCQSAAPNGTPKPYAMGAGAFSAFLADANTGIEATTVATVTSTTPSISLRGPPAPVYA